MSDLLNKLGNKESSAKGTGSPGPNQSTEGKSTTQSATVQTGGGLELGTDLIKNVGNSKPEAAATAKAESAGEKETPVATKSESEGENVVKDPDSWTKDSALKEIKRLREENKIYRLKHEEKIGTLKTEMEARLQQKEEEVKSAEAYKQELEELKAKEADKKRDLNEKLAHREALLAELKAKEEARAKIHREEIENLKKKINTYEADYEAQQAVYKQRLNSELEVIPEKFKEIAEYIVKGAGDPREAVVALNEAKLKGVFEDKTVVVNHSVPGAKDGARSTNERLQEVAKEERSKLTPQQKIAMGLKGIRSGEPNTMFRK